MRRKFVFVLVGIALVVGLIGLPPAPAAQAATGYRLEMYASCLGKGVYVSWIKVTGTNEFGKIVTWPGSNGGFYSPPTISAITWGWYWRGNVTIWYRLTNGKP